MRREVGALAEAGGEVGRQLIEHLRRAVDRPRALVGVQSRQGLAQRGAHFVRRAVAAAAAVGSDGGGLGHPLVRNHQQPRAEFPPA